MATTYLFLQFFSVFLPLLLVRFAFWRDDFFPSFGWAQTVKSRDRMLFLTHLFPGVLAPILDSLIFMYRYPDGTTRKHV